ncbi:MAG: chorismate mutase [Eubacteriales bacterium]|nr:chorismate mutase [Eubacteriales bacterium]
MELSEIRKEIDRIDTQMKELFLQRMACAEKVAEAKMKTGGDVFVPSREDEIIEKRTSDVENVKDEYTEFLRHLMSVSRRYQYGKLTEMQDAVLAEALSDDFKGADETGMTRISFRLADGGVKLNLFMNVLQMNGIDIESMELRSEEGGKTVTMLLRGSINEPDMRRALCQIGKEAEALSIMSIEE